MEFRILGSLEVLDEGREVALGGSKQRALLAVLLLHANETLSTDRLIDELWGETPPATAAKTVQVHVSRLRKALRAETTWSSPASTATSCRSIASGSTLTASSASSTTDAPSWRRAAPTQAAAALEQALALWRGTPLADLAYEPFAQGEIGRLGDLHAAAVEQQIEAKLALGRHAEVVGQLENLIAEHPYRERLRGQLMLALYRCERQADALQAYQDARVTLVEELGIEPGERLRGLEAAILAQDPALALPSRSRRRRRRSHPRRPRPSRCPRARPPAREHRVRRPGRIDGAHGAARPRDDAQRCSTATRSPARP